MEYVSQPVRVLMLCSDVSRSRDVRECLEGNSLQVCSDEESLAESIRQGDIDVVLVCAPTLPEACFQLSSGSALIWLTDQAPDASPADALLRTVASRDELRDCVQLLGEQAILERHAEELGRRLDVARIRYKWRGNPRRKTWPELREMAIVDPVTGVFARRYLDEILHHEFGKSKATGVPLSLLIVDLDNFKEVNDAGGHLAGDQVLKQAAGRMRAVLRDGDAVCRFGGDEFAIVAPGAGSHAAFQIADRVRLAVVREPYRTNDLVYTISCSIGISSTLDTEVTSAAELVHHADLALLAAKRRGGNQVLPAIFKELENASTDGPQR